MTLFLKRNMARRDEMEETVICKMCLEPIFNFICINCLRDGVQNWLGSIKPSLLKEFSAFHQQILNHFSSNENQEKCMKCKKTIDTVLCPYCYEKEVFWLIFSKDVRLAKKFAKLFNFDFLGTGYLPTVTTRNLEPIILVDKKRNSDMNICENCGQTSDDLKEENGAWLCETCREL